MMHSTKSRCSSSHIVAKWVSNWYIYPRIPPTQAAAESWLKKRVGASSVVRARRLISGGHAYEKLTYKKYINPYCLHWHSGLLREDRGEVGATWAMVKYNRPWVHWLTESLKRARYWPRGAYYICAEWWDSTIRIGHSSCKYSPSVWKRISMR